MNRPQFNFAGKAPTGGDDDDDDFTMVDTPEASPERNKHMRREMGGRYNMMA